jgi:putative SOS response-associated peptidase YedK
MRLFAEVHDRMPAVLRETVQAWLSGEAAEHWPCTVYRVLAS